MAGIKQYDLGSSTAIDPGEAHVLKHTKRRNQDGVFQDFIPDPNDVPLPPNRPRAEQVQDAYESSLRRQEVNRATGMAVATAKLETMNAVRAIAFIKELPPRVQELYLLAEEAGQNRKTVMSQFPPPSKTARGEASPHQAVVAEVAAWSDAARERSKLNRIPPTAPRVADPGFEVEVLDAQLAAEEAQAEESEDDLQEAAH